ncbi:hypothetical protein HRbin36_02042 [bacterium HR36]|nr:hypothetical protein HRbin36_02042 [bacterium HR36]
MTVCQLLHESCGTVSGGFDQVRMHASAKTQARFTGQLKMASGTPNADGIEIGRLQENFAGVRGDFGIATTHNAGQGDGPGTVSNHEMLRKEPAFLPVQGDERFVRSSRSDDDLGLLPASTGTQFFVIERMQGLAPFQHDVIGNIHQVVDRAHP